MIWINCALMECSSHPTLLSAGGYTKRWGPRFSMSLRRLNRSQIKEECPGIFARETKRWHIRMVDHQAFAQAVGESIKIHSAIERAEGRSTDVRTPAALADRMTLRAHSLRKRATMSLQRAGPAVLGPAGRCCEQQADDCEPRYHVRPLH